AIGQHDQVVKLLEEALSLKKASFGPAQTEDLEGMSKMAESHARAGRLKEAQQLRAITQTLYKARLGPMDWDTLSTMNTLAKSYAELGQHEKALKLYEDTR